jgi:hypothetical protein
MDISHLVISEMASTGCSVGTALENIERKDPAVSAAWMSDRGQWKTVSGWKKWFENMGQQAEGIRNKASSGWVPAFSSVVQLYQREGLSLGQSVKKAVHYFGDSHAKWLEAMHTSPQPANFRQERPPAVTLVPPTTPRKESPAMSTSAPRTFEQAIESLILQGVPRIEAVRQAVREHPDLHQDFIDRAQRMATSFPADHLRGGR